MLAFQINKKYINWLSLHSCQLNLIGHQYQIFASFKANQYHANCCQNQSIDVYFMINAFFFYSFALLVVGNIGQVGNHCSAYFRDRRSIQICSHGLNYFYQELKDKHTSIHAFFIKLVQCGSVSFFHQQKQRVPPSLFLLKLL